MATGTVIYKVQLQVADVDRNYYHDHTLTLARHPSENDERMMVRLLAFALNASDRLAFSSSLSNEGEPELSALDDTGAIDLWVLFGQNDEKWLRKASQRARQAKVYAYGRRSVPIWWQQNGPALQRYTNLQVWEIPEPAIAEMIRLVSRSMSLQCSINEGLVWWSDTVTSIPIEPVLLKDFG